jgi:hypothetical protein
MSGRSVDSDCVDKLGERSALTSFSLNTSKIDDRDLDLDRVLELGVGGGGDRGGNI